LTRSGFQQWVVANHGMVYAVVFSVLRDRVIADEVVQDTFLVAYERRHQLRHTDRPGPWLRVLARNQALDRLRRRHREAEIRAREPQDESHEAPTSAPEAAIAEAFARLDHEERCLLLQFHLEAGEHPLQRARATEGLSAEAAAIIDGWIDDRISLIEMMERLDWTNPSPDHVEDRDGSLTIRFDVDGNPVEP